MSYIETSASSKKRLMIICVCKEIKKSEIFISYLDYQYTDSSDTKKVFFRRWEMEGWRCRCSWWSVCGGGWERWSQMGKLLPMSESATKLYARGKSLGMVEGPGVVSDSGHGSFRMNDLFERQSFLGQLHQVQIRNGDFWIKCRLLSLFPSLYVSMFQSSEWKWNGGKRYTKKHCENRQQQHPAMKTDTQCW